MRETSQSAPTITRKILLIAGLCASIHLSAVDLALAQSSGAFAPLETAVQMIVDFITGPFGRLLAIIAVIGLGFLAFAGRLSWFTAGAVVLGIGLVFGAPAIVDQMISAVGN
jgi:type IV secretion system protein VirB2